MNPRRLLRAILFFIALFHCIFGVGLMFSVDFQQMAVAGYGGILTWSGDDIYFLRVIGSFAFVLGTLAWMAARDPLRHKAIVIGFIEFFILRNIHRHLYANELYEALQVSPFMNTMTSVFFGLQAALLAFLLWRAARSESGRDEGAGKR